MRSSGENASQVTWAEVLPQGKQRQSGEGDCNLVHHKTDSISHAQRLSELAITSWLPTVEDHLGAQVVLLSDVVGAAQFTGANAVAFLLPLNICARITLYLPLFTTD